MRLLVLVHALVLVICVAGAGPTEDRTQFPPTYMPSGEQMYKQYCAACHGADARGHGPAASFLTTPPPGLDHTREASFGQVPLRLCVECSQIWDRSLCSRLIGHADVGPYLPVLRQAERKSCPATHQESV
jgi:hypothetical protein